MASFNDKTGKAWKLDLNFNLWGKIKDSTGINLLEITSPESESLEKLSSFENLGNVLWLFVEDQAAADGVDRETFWKGLNGPAMEAGTRAILENLEEFTGSPQVAALRVGLDDAMERVRQMNAEIRKDDGEIRKKIRESLFPA